MDRTVVEKVDGFFSQYKHQSYKKGEILIRADEEPSGVYYLNTGQVKEYAISKKGEELVINVFKQGAFFPMSWAINETPNAYFFEAMTNIDILRALRGKVIEFIKKNPDVLYDLMSRVYKGTDGMLTRMTYLMSGNAYTRLITELLIYVKRFKKGQDAIELTISEKDLAAQTGMTRETVSREMKILKDKKIIIQDKTKFVIQNIRRLEEELDSI